jgi:beta-lactamase class A
MCSTFKAPLAAAVMARIDAGTLDANDILTFDPVNLLSTSPATARHPDGRISVIAACEGAVSTSDNTAANLLLNLIGGPPALTAFFRTLGDDITRLDRYELELNSNIDGDPRDTTTPDAMLGSLQAILLNGVLQPASRDLLSNWMLNEQNGRARIRAGLQRAGDGWLIANKPGTSINGATNDIAIAWPPNLPPMVFAAFVNAPEADAKARQDTIARVAQMAAQEFLAA